MFRRSPVAPAFRYPGNKQTLLRFYDKLIPEGFTSLVDAFGGSGVVSANATVDHVVYNEKFFPLYSVIEYLSETPAEAFIGEVRDLESRFGLAASKGDLSARRDAFHALRDSYNDSPSAAAYFLLVAYCFQSRMSFSKDGKCKSSCGAVDRKMVADFEKRVSDFCAALQRPGLDLDLVNGSYEDIDIPDGALVFLDPPYYGSAVLYGGWDLEAECRFLMWLEDLDRNGIKFMLTNNLFYGNLALETQIIRMGFNRIRVPISVSRKSKYMRGEQNYGKAKKEVVVTNFDAVPALAAAA